MIRKIRKALRTLWRSAITGRFVSKKYAAEHPETTVEEKRPYDRI